MSTTVCVECNAEIPDASEFCPGCGFPVHSGETRCPECLNQVLLSLDACPECGFPLEELRQRHAPMTEEPAAKNETDSQPPAKIPAKGRAAAAPAAGRKPKGRARSMDAGENVADQVLQAQVDSFNELTAVINKMVDNSSSGSINELVASIRNFVNSAENTNNDMLSDLITNIGRFVESSEKIKDDMVNSLKEQNLSTTSAMQEIVNSFSSEVRAAAVGIQQAQKTALDEMNGVAKQVKTAALISSENSGVSEGSPYVLYICAILTVFTILNFFVTAYVVRLVK